MNTNPLHTLANLIEGIRRKSPVWIRKLVPRSIKDLFIDLEWNLYRSQNLNLNKQLKNPGNPILIISIPKSGTHLVKSLILSLPGTRLRNHFPSGIETSASREDLDLVYKKRLLKGRPGDVFSWHACYDPALATWLDQNNIKRIFIYRDPRDYTVSLHHFISDNPFQLPRTKLDEIFSNLENDRERLMKCITGIGQNGHRQIMSSSHLGNVHHVYQASMNWLNDPNTFCLRYEDLINNDPDQVKSTLLSILNYLEIAAGRVSESAVDELVSTGLDNKKSPTFRLGKKGSWRHEYNREHVETFKQVAGDLLIKLGYEKNNDWSAQ